MRGRVLAVAAGSALLLGWWSDGSRPAVVRDNEPPNVRAAACTSLQRPLGGADLAYAAVAVRTQVAAHARPHGKKLATFGRRNENGFVTVFGVVGEVLGRDCAPVWYRVQLPLRPNGSTGYVQASAVRVVPLRTRIEVDLSDRLIEVFRGGRRILRTVAGVGRAGTETPTGRFYVNQLLLSGNPDGVFGPGAIGISAFAPRLGHWPQGGPIAIHGTDQPVTIGRAASLGCLRVANSIVFWFFRNVPAGTPVLIRP
jgi:lipoprotein-anchoring transpeptidase ErfK/SrfK